jgi:Flp pilus assembly protein TadG
MAIRRFAASESGNFGMMFAIAAPVFFAGIGLALDVSTLANARSQLQSSLDSAVLAASRLDDASKSRDDLFHAFLAANLANTATISNPVGKLTIDKGLNYIETAGTVTADVKLTFMRGFGQYDKVTVNSAAYEATNELEVAMVLDNTGSMGASNMAALRSAASALVDILANAKSNNRKVTAALVPFVAQVNVKGEGYSESWIDKNGKAPYHGVNFDKNGSVYYNHLDLFTKLNVAWKGCVEARPAPYNLNDDAPDATKPSTLFVPAFAPDNPGAAAKSPNLSNKWNNSYLGDSFTSSDSAKVKTIARYLSASTTRYIDENGPRSTGPNYACATPIVPLTSDFAKLKTEISKMIHWEGGGTNVSEGLAWGMRVLSPGEPYAQGKPFKADGVSKVVVVFTDGENTVFGASSESFNTSDYGAYGFLDSNRMGTTNRGTALTNVNTWTQSMCTALKNQDVQIFTVLLGADTAANRTLYSTCASNPSNYYPTSDVSQLKAVFQKIGTAVAQLSLTH